MRNNCKYSNKSYNSILFNLYGTSDSTGTAKTLYEYDVIGRLSKKTFPDGRTETYTLDHNERVTELTHADGSSRKTSYNGLGFITKETDEEGFVTEHEYNVWGGEVYRKVKTSENGTEVRTWKNEYTVFGEVKSEESGDGRKWNYEYNSRGFVTKRTAPNGTVQTIGYDGCGRKTSDSRALGSVSLTRNFAYDPEGFIKSGTDSGITTAFNLSGSSYSANAYGLVTACKTTVGNKAMSSAFSYDEGKRLCGLSYPDSAKTVYGYNGIGQLVSAGNTGSATAYANTGIYDTTGHLTSLKGGNSLTRTESWNNTKGLLESYSWGISATNTLTWNSRGNISSQVKNKISYTYEYDKKDQLEKEWKNGAQLSAWTYDAAGNRKKELRFCGPLQDLTFYSKSDLIMSDPKWKYNYDASGNMTYRGNNAAEKTDGGLFEGWTFNATSGEVWKYEYDLFNRLIKVEHSYSGVNGLKQAAEYKYDFRDLMVCRITGSGSSTVTEYFAYDAEGKLIYTEKGTEKHNYVYANGKIWCEVVTTGSTKNTYYHHTDHLGTTVCITDSSGAELWNCEKDAFGMVLFKKDGTFTPNFTGKLLDQNTGLYYFNARWYDPEMGRFITEDPARDGRNWFVYCGNNPITHLDSSGLETTVMIIHANSSWERMAKGSHVAIHFSNPGKDSKGDFLRQTLYDPSGSYEADNGFGNGKYRPSSGVFEGDVSGDLESYINSVLNRENGEYIVSYKIDTTPEQESKMIESANKIGDGFGFNCADNTSTILKEIGFKHTMKPGKLEQQLKKSDIVKNIKTYKKEQKNEKQN